MDYDDNDIHGQNLHLAGEGSSKFSPVLHPYALSKFDFDDGLQSQLRFDSLVDNEVFLGIPSQEDNQWIEDFSRGSSGIEFSSSAAESCSISRRNNVWSEATSTESVEMLLKSVGQEEMIPGDTIIEESDACDESGGLTGVMEHQLKQDDEAKDAMDSEPALPSNEFMEHFCRLNDVVCTSQNQEVEITARGSSHVLDPNVSSETCVVNGTGGVSRKCDDANQTEVGILVNEAHDKIMEKDSSGSGMQNDDTHSSSQDIASASIQLLNIQEPEHQVSEISFENANGLFFDTGKAAEEQKVPSKDTDVDGQVLKGIQVRTDAQNIERLPCPSEAESIEQQAVEACISNIEEPSSLPVKGEGNLQIGEGCSEDLRSIDSEKASKCEPVDMSNSLEIHGQLRGNMHEDLPIVVEGGCNLEVHAIEVSNLKDGTLASSELKVDQTKLGDNSLVDAKARLRGSDRQLDNEASVNYVEASLTSGVESDNRFSDGQGDGSCSNYLGDLPSLTVACSSTELVGETRTLENLEGVDDASGVHNEDSNAEDHASVPMVAGSLQTSERNLVSISNEVQSSQDVSFKERGNAKLPNESSPVDREIVESPSSARRVEPLSQGEEIKVNIEYVQESEYVTTAPALNVHYEKHSALHDRVDGVPLLSETGAAVDQGSDHPDETTKTEEEGPKDTNILTLKESSQGASEQGLVLELEKGIYHSSTCKLSHKDVDQSLPTLASNLESGTEQSVESIHKTIDQSLPMVETSSTASGCEQAVKANEVSQISCNKLEVYLHLSDSAVKEGSNAEELVPGNHEEATVQENCEVEPLKVAGGGSSADSVKPDFGTSTVVSQSEKEKEELKESMSGSVSLTEVTAQYTSQNVSGNNAAKDERSFNFEVQPSAGLLGRETRKDGESVTTIQTFKTPTIVEGSPSTPSIGQLDHKIVLELSHGSSQASVQEIARGGSKSTPERKTKRPSGRASRKENAKRGDHVMETTPTRQTERGDKSCSVSSGTGQAVQFEGLRPVGNVECSGVRGVASIPTSNLPDLNTSVPPSALFHQPFTDLQQVQLRAQIFVYGSLIQRAAPDEACMVSAFGASEGGRSVWEPVWRSYMERIQGQKSHPSKSETPVQPRSGARPPDQSIIRGAHQSKVALSPLGQASSKGTPSPVANPMIPLSSPLWNVSTPCDAVQSSGMPRTGVHDYHQTLPPLHPFQTPPPRGFVGHNWLSQTHFPGPWVASPQTSAFDANAHFSVSPVTETVKLTPVKESAGPVTSGTKHASPFTLVHSSGPSVVAETSSLSDMKTMTVFPTPNSTALKGRKRKKVTVSEDLSRISLLAQPQTESVSTPVVHSNLSTSVVVSTPALFASKTDASKVITAVSPPSSTGHAKRVEQNAEQNVISKETLCKVEEAELQAQDAAALAATAVSHSQSVWSQLDKQKNSRLGPTIEAKLASAAVAVAAAASVAKAAAAAAKIASNAALQAKLMADEVLASSGPSNPAQSYPSSLPAAHNLGNATPASILMGGNGSTSSGSIIVAAREAARRRVEAASAASKQAENLDAILKAAELAAEAVSQAGKIVGMGSPLPLIELVEAGPEGYWRVPQLPPEQGVISKSKHRERSNVDSIKDGPNVPGGHSEDGPLEEAKIVSRGLSPLSGEDFRESTKDHPKAADGISSSITTRETDSRVKRSRRASDFAKTIGVVPESEIESTTASIRTPDEYEKGVGTAGENSIKEGCLVEVQKDGDEFKTAWFSANVLGLQDRKAFVCYTELQSDEGSGQLREWVTLEAEANNAPRIRIAHPMTTMQFEGTRKRRRAARGDYLWSVGDRVDVWMQNCWRGGVLTEKNKKDDTIFTVHFPAEGKTSVVKAWHLRPTLIWKDGEWIEQSSSREKDPSSQGDTPQEKRLKLGIPAIEIREKDIMSKTIELVESGKPDESRLLPLSANEKEFNIGDQNKPIAPRTNRTGLQKEGSRVIFGVPKPGKKRKFMEVSKHYVAERSGKTNESNDSVKFAKYLMPQGSGSRGWKNTKIVAKEKQAVESKTKVLKSGKSLSVFGRTLPQKDKVSTSAVSAQNDGPTMDHMIKDSGSIDAIVSQQQSSMEFSKPEGAAEGPVLFSTLALPSGAPSKKKSTSNVRSQRVNVGKLAASSRKLANVEVKEQPSEGNPGNEAAEPRRSNRRIQPTSRLLEGLQSSLVIPKFPAVSHDKSHRSHNRGTSSKGRE